MLLLQHVVRSISSASCKRVFQGNLNLLQHSKQLPLSYRKMSFKAIERGSLNTLGYRIYYANEAGLISPFHDIPLFADKNNRIYNMIVEIPRWTNAKMEISTKEPLNPIKQDTKNGELRYVHNCFPHHGYIWNYGALPQTWEDPNHVDESTSCKGDNDPIDICEIGYRVAKRGEILQVKILGVMALIDEGETDWKLIAIDINDPLAEKLNDVEDIEKHMPGFIAATHEWFMIYKMPAGKPANKFAFNGDAKNREFAEKIIEETHNHWQKLIKGETDANDIDCSTLTIEDSPNRITAINALQIHQQTEKPGPPQETDPSVDKWHFTLNMI